MKDSSPALSLIWLALPYVNIHDSFQFLYPNIILMPQSNIASLPGVRAGILFCLVPLTVPGLCKGFFYISTFS